MFLGTSICYQQLERPICSSGVSFASADTISMLTSPSSALHFFYLAVLLYFVKVAWDLKHCRRWESHVVLEHPTLLKRKYFLVMEKRKVKSKWIYSLCLRSSEILSVFQLMVRLGTIWNWLLMSLCYILFSLFYLQHFPAFCLSDL